MNKVFAWIFIFVGAYGIFLVWPQLQQAGSAGLALGSAFPQQELEKSDGSWELVPADNGSVKVVNVWATWCEPCRDELPMLHSMARQWSDKGVEFILVNEQLDSRQAVMAYLEFAHIDLPLYFLRQQDSQRLGGIRYVPTTFIVDQRGSLVTRFEGLINGAELTTELRRLTVK